MKNLGVILIVVVFTFLNSLYFVLFSPITANNTRIIEIRKEYSKYITKNKSLDNCASFFQPITVLRTRSTNNTIKYTYSLNGKLTHVNDVENYVTLECSNGKKYNLAINVESTDEKDWITIPQGRNTQSDNPKEHPFIFNTQDLTKSILKDQYYKNNTVYDFIWEEDRSLSEIYKAMKKNKNDFVNNNGGIIIGLLR